MESHSLGLRKQWLLILCSPYLCTPLLIQLHRHQSRRSLLADGGVAALPEEVTALLLPDRRHLDLLRVLSSPNCSREMSFYSTTCSTSAVRFVLQTGFHEPPSCGLTSLYSDSSIVRSSNSLLCHSLMRFCKRSPQISQNDWFWQVDDEPTWSY